MTPNRIVVLLSPLFVSGAGYVAELAAKYLPGHPHLDSTQLTAIFIAGATFATAKVYKWLDGWQAHEFRATRLPVVPVDVPHEQL